MPTVSRNTSKLTQSLQLSWPVDFSPGISYGNVRTNSQKLVLEKKKQANGYGAADTKTNFLGKSLLYLFTQRLKVWLSQIEKNRSWPEWTTQSFEYDNRGTGVYVKLSTMHKPIILDSDWAVILIYMIHSSRTNFWPTTFRKAHRIAKLSVMLHKMKTANSSNAN